MSTYGVCQTIYETSLLKSASPSTIAWIGSIQVTLLMLVSCLAGPFYDAGYFRALLMLGTFLVVFGHMVLSLCTSFWQFLLAQGFCMGIGAGCLFVPSVAIVATYFNTRLALATGLAVSGSSLGGVIYPIVLHRLFGRIGFAWSVRVLGFTTLATLLFSNACMKPRVLPPAKRSLVDWNAFRSLPFVLFCIGSLLVHMGLFTYFFYIQVYALNITTENLAFSLLSILKAASIFGRIVPNFVADKVGPLNIIIPCAAISGVLGFCLIPTSSLGGIITLAILFGFFSGTFVSLPPTVVVRMCPDRRLIGTWLGMCYSISAIGALVGAPAAGAVLGAKGFESLWIFCGSSIVSGGLVMAGSRFAFTGGKLMVKT